MPEWFRLVFDSDPSTSFAGWPDTLDEREWIWWSGAVVNNAVKVDINAEAMPVSYWQVQFVLEKAGGTLCTEGVGLAPTRRSVPCARIHRTRTELLLRLRQTMRLQVTQYDRQKRTWPATGRCILAQYDESHVVVYQAFLPSIGRFAAEHGYFGGEFSYTRMSWCKPNFLWMMYRSGWGTKAGQDVTLAIWLNRAFFDTMLALAVPSMYSENIYPDSADWKAAVRSSDARMQWDPDRGPGGGPLQRRALQLGLRGKMLEEYGRVPSWALKTSAILWQRNVPMLTRCHQIC